MMRRVKLTVREAAQLLSISESEIYRWVDDGDIPCTMVNHQPLFSRAELLEWATEHRIPVSIALFEGGGDSGSLTRAIECGGVHLDVAGGDRAATLRAVVACLPINDADERELVLSVMLAREREASTGIGDGIAIPHVRGPLVFADKPVHVVFAMMTPTIRGHLQLLSRLSLALHDELFKAAVARRAPRDELLREVKRIEAALPNNGDHPAHTRSDAPE
jgi:nitrogen PTS system EIIA component